MSTPTTIARLTELLVDQLGIEASDVQPESKLVEDLGADSLDIVEIVMAVEETWEVEIPDADSEKFRTVQDVVTYLDKVQPS